MTFENPPLISSSEEADILLIAVNQTELKEEFTKNWVEAITMSKFLYAILFSTFKFKCLENHFLSNFDVFKSPNIETTYGLMYSTFKVDDLCSTK